MHVQPFVGSHRVKLRRTEFDFLGLGGWTCDGKRPLGVFAGFCSEEALPQAVALRFRTAGTGKNAMPATGRRRCECKRAMYVCSSKIKNQFEYQHPEQPNTADVGKAFIQPRSA